MKERINKVRELLKNGKVPETFFDMKDELKSTYVKLGEIRGKNEGEVISIQGSFSGVKGFEPFGGFRVGFVDLIEGDVCIGRAIVETVLLSKASWEAKPSDVMAEFQKMRAVPLSDAMALESAMNATAITQRPKDDIRIGVVREYAVRDSHRGRNLGSMLLEVCYDLLTREKNDRVYCVLTNRASAEASSMLLQDVMTGKETPTEEEMDMIRGLQYYVCSTAVQNSAKLAARTGLIARLPSLSAAALLTKKVSAEENKIAA